MITAHPFPASFDGSPWIYGSALLADLLVSALGLAQLLAYVFEGRRKRDAGMIHGARFVPNPLPLWCSLNVYRAIIIGFLLTLVLRSLPDALWMLAWGEVSIETMHVLTIVDWSLDAAAMVPMLFTLALIAWSWQVIPQALIQAATIPLARPKWEDAKAPIKIAVLVTTITIGVTLGKGWL